MIKVNDETDAAPGLCNLCPRACNADRSSNVTGYCKMGSEIYAARAALHMWEEPCISGKRGSGAVFFSGCQLRCVFCQNAQIASGSCAKKLTIERLARIFIELQEKKANNINLVTPTHFVPQIIKALDIAKNNGLVIPIVYNTSSYENVETIRMLEGYIDVYLPDLKYMDSAASGKYSNAFDYFEKAAAAIEEMDRQCNGFGFYEENDWLVKTGRVEAGIMKRGIIVRHLLLPGLSADSKNVIKYLYNTYGDRIFISIMNQYTPLPQVEKYPEINRTITSREYDEVVDYAIELGVSNGFIQEEGTQKDSFIPAFDYEGL
ncbi:MAG: radical SAM protein [Eubacteriales bacterium]|nr:radical SAM protein [Eubacteriales bacterium]